jgi:predicted nuclease with TOPRIM domain
MEDSYRNKLKDQLQQERKNREEIQQSNFSKESEQQKIIEDLYQENSSLSMALANLKNALEQVHFAFQLEIIFSAQERVFSNSCYFAD